GLPAFYSADFFSQADRLLQRARAKVAGEPEKYRQRIDFLAVGLKFSQLLMQAIDAMAKVRSTGGRDRAAVEHAIGVWKTIDRHCIDNKPYAINLSLDPKSRF